MSDIAWLLAQGDVVGANECLTVRRSSKSDDPQELLLWSRVMMMRGRLGQAREALGRALKIAPEFVEAQVECARAMWCDGEYEQALRQYAETYALAKPSSPWILEYVERLAQHERMIDAIEVADRYCQAMPADAAGWFWLGYVLQIAGHAIQARDAYRRCERLVSDQAMLKNNLAALHLQLEECETAQFYAEEAILDEPSSALAWSNLAAAHLKQGRIDAAECAIERAMMLKPDYPTALQTYSYVCKERQNWNQARASLMRAHALSPHDWPIRWSLAMLQLLFGEYEAGWRNFEYRWQAGELKGKWPTLPAPVWQGESLEGKTLFIWSEQGYGDVLQLIRFVPRLAGHVHRQGGRLTCCVFPPLLSLLARSIGAVVDGLLPSSIANLPTCDYHLPLGSVPLRLNVGMEDVSDAIVYLKPDPERIARWRHRLGDTKKLRVGVVWSGSRSHQRNRMRSIEPEQLGMALAGTRDIEFFNLQVDASNDLELLRMSGLELKDHTAEFYTFDDTAAYLSNLDLVVTVCTSIAHLAGGLGKPTWLLLDVNPHWVWMTDREDSPWYPSIRLYRQETFGEWGAVLERIKTDLAQEAGCRVDHDAARAGE
ncbi:tetratricopeptide repeat protein [Burkholderia seminalis]|uniref:tetratricopeptide repeat protein n=1 Tax=Burkholderia seminalis TaxID=488731 RepID=UPI00264B63D4|nr:tetratricopeptide repeat protein [Burkholderia seminalis]MDN7592075.1 hypothetical protein [Burkholderia seminalis]